MTVCLSVCLAGDSSSGIRLEILAHQKKHFRALETVSYVRAQKEVPRIVLAHQVPYDDGEMDLVLDFCLPLTDEWRRFRPDQALKSIPKSAGAREEVPSEKIKEMIAGSFTTAGQDGDLSS